MVSTAGLSVEEFVAQESARLGRFKAWWDARNQEDPEMFQGRLDEADWYEQYIAFAEQEPE